MYRRGSRTVLLRTFLLIHVVRASIEPATLSEESEDVGHMYQFIKTILIDYPCRNVFLVKAEGDDGEMYGLTSRLIGEMALSSVNIESQKINQFNGPYAKFSYSVLVFRQTLYFVFVPNVTIAYSILSNVQKIYLFRSRHRVILITNNKPVDLEEIQLLFKACWLVKIVNIALIFGPEEIYTYFPFINDFAFRVNGSFFPDKYKNLNGHTLRLSAFIGSLDTLVLKHGGDLIGRDVFLWQAIVKTMNATSVKIEPSDRVTYGLKFPNGTMTGAFADVAKNVTDLAINSRMVKLQFENILEGTYPHDNDNVAVLVPSAANVPDYLKFTMLFSWPLWWFILGSAVMFGVAWWWVVVPGQPVYASLEALTATLGNPLPEPDGAKERLLLMLYTSYMFFILAAYHGTLTSVLTVPIKAPEINTLGQLDKSRLPIYAATRFKAMFLENAGSTLTVSLIQRIILLRDDPDIETLVAKHGPYAVVQKESFAYKSIYSRSNYYSDGYAIYRIMYERPMPSQVCYAARYGSPLIPRINRLLRRIGESGLNDYWKRTTIHRVILDEKLGDLPGPVSFNVVTFANISLAFIILAIGLVAAIIAALCEQAVHYRKTVLTLHHINA